VKIRSIIVQAAIYASILSACGGGDKVEPPIETQPQLGGIWRGTATDSVSGLTPRDIVILTADDGQFRLTSSVAVQAEGTVTLRQDDDDIDNLEGSVTAFAPEGFFFSDGAETSQCAISAVLVEKSSISGSYSCNNSADPDSPDTGTFTAAYDSLYDQGSSTTATQGIWANGELAVNIDADGSIISGQFANGCVITGGAISPIDIDFNLYSLDMTFDLTAPPDGTCAELSGFYTGLAFLGVNSGAKTVTFQVDNGTEIFTDILQQ